MNIVTLVVEDRIGDRIIKSSTIITDRTLSGFINPEMALFNIYKNLILENERKVSEQNGHSNRASQAV